MEETNNKNKNFCQCGCGAEIPLISKNGQPQRFKYGHGIRGKNNPNYGKHFKLSEEHKQILRERMLGINNPNYGKRVKHSEETIEKIRQGKLGVKNPNYGKHFTMSEETKLKMKQNVPKGEKHYLWKGNNVKNAALHLWVRSHLPEPDLCQICNLKPPHDLANKTGIYNRDFSNWFYLCRRCHMLSDGRMKNLKYQS